METIQKFSIPIAIIIAGALIAGAVYFASIGRGTGNNGAPAPSVKVDIKDVQVTASDPYIGNANAPVTIAYWSDYQCPFCKAVEVGGIPQIQVDPAIPIIIKNYVDTGKVKIVFKDFPFLGEDSITASIYEHAIWELYPSKFYTWREAMLKAQDEEGDQGFGDEASILKLIGTISGMDADVLKAKVAAKKDTYAKTMEADRAEGAKLGVSGTPAFIIGTQLISGAQPIGVFTSALDIVLKK
ncbi:MAG: thioredoxin domain-containing protein [bacterium]|nr:thioredoxin domain-containing protein [bacterium]